MNTFSIAVLTTSVVMFLVSFSSATNDRVDTGNGYIYNLSVTQDVYIHDSSNHNNEKFLAVAKHTGLPKSRILLQFENLPSTCRKITSAKMYLGYWYSYKKSSMTVQEVPFISRELQVHQIKQAWREDEATSINRQSNTAWNSPFLDLDGTDSERHVEDTVNIFTNRPIDDYIEFDITTVAQKWKSGEDNYGVLVRATNEDQDGHEARFFSKEHTTGKKAFVLVLCTQ